MSLSYLFGDKNIHRMIDTETNDLRPSIDSIIDLAYTDLENGKIQPSVLYKMGLSEAEAKGRAKFGNKIYYASEAEVNKNVRNFTGPYTNFTREAISTTLNANGPAKTLWIKNLGFESRHFAPHLIGSNELHNILGSAQGYTEWARQSGRIEGMIPLPIIHKQSKLKELRNLLAANPSDIHLQRQVRNATIGIAHETIRQGFDIKQTANTLLDVDWITHGVLAKASARNLIKDTGDYFTGSSADYILQSFFGKGAAHGAKADTRQGFPMMAKLLSLNQELTTGNIKPSTAFGFAKLDAMRSIYGEKYNTLKNYLDVLDEFKTYGKVESIKGEFVKAKANMYMSKDGTIVPLENRFKDARTIYDKKAIDEFFVGRGLGQEHIDRFANAEIPDIAQARVEIDTFKESVFHKIGSTKTEQELSSAINELGNIKLFGNTVKPTESGILSKLPKNMPWKKIGIGAAAFVGYKLLFDNVVPEKHNNLGAQERKKDRDLQYSKPEMKVPRGFNIQKIHTMDADAQGHYRY